MTDLPACDAPAPRVLVVDDSPVNLALAEAMLQDCGASVDTAASAREALEFAQKTAYALVLMDIRMDGGDGITAAKDIRAFAGHCSHVPIVALTADTSPHQEQACLAAGLDGFIAKPLDIWALAAALERWCGFVPAPIDTAVFAELRAGIAAERFRDLASRFVSEGPRRNARLHAAAARQDHETVGREAHTLKSMAALFGAGPLTTVAAAVERCALRQEACENLVAELSKRLADTCSWLEREIRERRT